MISIAITCFIVFLTFIAPFWLKVILIALNMFIPDSIPFLDEIVQGYAVLKTNPFIRVINLGRKARKVGNFFKKRQLKRNAHRPKKSV